jgi:hypothetical protein
VLEHPATSHQAPVAGGNQVMAIQQSTADRFWSRVERRSLDECWPWKGSKSRGNRGRFCLDGRRTAAPRVAWELTRGPIPKGLCACHSCDNPNCVNPDHLWLGTYADNSRDAITKGRSGVWKMRARMRLKRLDECARGEGHGCAKLKTSDVIEIRRRHTGGEATRSLCIRFGVSSSTVLSIVNRETWSHVA